MTWLALRARGGDSGALAGFVEAGYDGVWRLCASLVGESGADDLAQETFARAVKALPKFRGESSARTWLLTIARHACVDELRARTRRRRRDAAMGGGEEGQVADASAQVTTADLLSQLEPERRTAFVLTQVIGLSYAEAARVSECPTGTIRSRVARARADLVALVERAGKAAG
ncbi:MAG TPA: sigma-70 family RNA polymerase sigma factor [Acidimicrobiales bacterium]|nr:sigma-70 family RNA polymerase sigma factor [Acidimicrobiales bacterium]